MVKDYFKGKEIEFEDINVAEDRAAAHDMVERSGQMGVPVIDIDGELIIGFDVPKIEGILSKKGKGGAEKVSKPEEPGSDEGATQKQAIEEQEIKEEEAQSKVYDVLIIGGSAAGLTAAIFATRREMKTLVVTKDLGGQISETLGVENYPGIDKIEGPELVQAFEAQAKKFGADILSEEVVAADEKEHTTEGKAFVVKTKDGDEYAGRSLILAMGKTPRSLKVPGEDTFLGKGVSYCANCDAPLFRGKTVAVVGGGNSAFDAALLLSKITSKVYLIHRRKEFRAFEAIIDQVKNQPNVEFLLNSVIVEIKGDKFVNAISVKNNADNSTKDMALDGVFVEIGSTVKTEFVEHLVDLDELGQVKTNKNTETSRSGVFAAGDVTDTAFKQIVAAAGEGCKAALAAYNYLHDIENKYVADWSAHKPK
jgi:thioredoxin reductase (NADPH)